MSKYADMVNSAAAISPAVGGARKAADIVAALAPPPQTPALSLVGQRPGQMPMKPPANVHEQKSLKDAVIAALPGVVGAVAGAVLVPKHRVLGALAGHAIGATALPLIKGEDRTGALCQLAVEGAGVVGALAYKKHRVVGYGLGILAGAGATAFVSDSPARKYLDKLRNR